MSEPIGTAETFAGSVAKSRDECADVFIELIRLHHLIEVGIDPAVLSSHKKDNDARRGCREQLAQSQRVVRPKILA